MKCESQPSLATLDIFIFRKKKNWVYRYKCLSGLNFMQNSEAVCLRLRSGIVPSTKWTIQPLCKRGMSKGQAQIQQRSRRMKTNDHWLA